MDGASIRARRRRRVSQSGVLNKLACDRALVNLRGLWRGLAIAEEEMDQAREEMWGEFPREDV